jgi:hypothetical protein
MSYRRLVIAFFCTTVVVAEEGINLPLTSTILAYAIVAQILHKKPDLIDLIPTKYRRMLLIKFETGVEWTGDSNTLWETLYVLLSGPGFDIEVFIDGVDVLSPIDRKEFLLNLRRIWEMTSKKTNLKILITGRPYPEIEAGLIDLPFISPEKQIIGM